MDRHEQIEWAIGRWRTGNRRVQRPLPADWQHDYATAIEVALALLQRYRTTDELVAAYVTKALGEAWLIRLCALPSGRWLNSEIVQDAAYWQRLQELLGAPRHGA